MDEDESTLADILKINKTGIFPHISNVLDVRCWPEELQSSPVDQQWKMAITIYFYLFNYIYYCK